MFVEVSDGFFYQDPVIYNDDWFLDVEQNYLFIDYKISERKLKTFCKNLGIATFGFGQGIVIAMPPTWNNQLDASKIYFEPTRPLNHEICKISSGLKLREVTEGGIYCWNFNVPRSRLETFIKGSDCVVTNNLLKIMEPQISIWSERDRRINKLKKTFKKILKEQEGERIKLTRKGAKTYAS